MKTRRFRKSLGFVVAAELTVAAHLLLFLPPKAQAAVPAQEEVGVSGERALAVLKVETAVPVSQEPVAVNTTVPDVSPPPAYPEFSAIPTDEELIQARVFGEPLFPEAGEQNDSENQALAQAITTYLHGGDSEALEPLEGVVTSFPQSRWRVAVQANVGSWYLKKGYYTRAQRNLFEAWKLGKSSDTEAVRRLAEFAGGELMLLQAMFDQLDALEALTDEFAGRELSGGITEKLYVARTTLWGLRNDHERAIPSGSVALERVRLDKHEKREKEKKDREPGYEKKRFERHAELDRFPADHDGASLAEIQDLSSLTDLKLQMAKRESPQSEIPIPSVVHLKQGHFSALVEKRGERYRFDDPLLGGEVWMSREAFEEESSGYFLVEEGRLPPGWRRANRAETEPVRGMCAYGIGNPWHTRWTDFLCAVFGVCEASSLTPATVDEAPRGCEKKGMPQYSFHALRASLHIEDVPVGCQAPRGPSANFQVTYNQREATQPSTFTFSNLGARWTFGWLSYVEDDPTAVGQPVELYKRGGGRESYEGFVDGVSAPQVDTRAVLKIVSTSPIVYERHLASGSVEVFSQADGASTAPRRVFLTQKKDPAGNTLTFTYDGQLRLVSATDALSRVTTVSYELASDPLKITKVTDPYGRTARFAYNESGQLTKVTDVIGLSSEFEYGTNQEYLSTTPDFIRAMTTPYGKTTFRSGVGPYASINNNRWLEATDPLGGTERIEHILNGTNPLSGSDPSNTVPSGFTGNEDLNTHVSIYYDKLAMSRATTDPPDPEEGTIVRFRSTTTFRISGAQVQSVKRPLENRVWYEHEGETIQNGVGPSGRASKIGRVLDDGSSQIYRTEYNAVGRGIRQTDPTGRETIFVYGTGSTPDADPVKGTGLDLLAVRQKNGAVFETLGTFTYDTKHRLLTATDGLGNTYTYTYNTQGQLLTATTPGTISAPLGAKMTLVYDSDGYLLTATGPVAGSTTTYTYDSFGRVRTITPPLQGALTLDYDTWTG